MEVTRKSIEKVTKQLIRTVKELEPGANLSAAIEKTLAKSLGARSYNALMATLEKEFQGKAPATPKPETVLEQQGYQVFALKSGQKYCTIQIDNISVQLKRDDEGVSADLYANGVEDSEAIASAWATFAEAGNDPGCPFSFKEDQAEEPDQQWQVTPELLEAMRRTGIRIFTTEAEAPVLLTDRWGEWMESDEVKAPFLDHLVERYGDGILDKDENWKGWKDGDPRSHLGENETTFLAHWHGAYGVLTEIELECDGFDPKSPEMIAKTWIELITAVDHTVWPHTRSFMLFDQACYDGRLSVCAFTPLEQSETGWHPRGYDEAAADLDNKLNETFQ